MVYRHLGLILSTVTVRLGLMLQERLDEGPRHKILPTLKVDSDLSEEASGRLNLVYHLS
jgi:hypothetical protein